jgi:hypothetical protein
MTPLGDLPFIRIPPYHAARLRMRCGRQPDIFMAKRIG